MHFIIRIKDENIKLYIVSKEKWHRLYVLISGYKKPQNSFYCPVNLVKISVFEEEINRGDNGSFIFFTRKNGTLVFCFILALIGLTCILIIEILKIFHK